MKLSFNTLIDLHKPLTEDSKVIDIGGGKGEYAGKIIERFNCYVWIFEPNPDYVQVLRETFKDNLKVKIIEKAVGKSGKLYLNQLSSSFDKNWARSETFIEVRGGRWSDLHLIPDILKINCEGGEYEALKEDFSLVPEILVQFHKVDGYEEKIGLVKEKLKLTHKIIYSEKWDLWQKF